MFISDRTASVVPAVLLTVLALSGCGARETQSSPVSAATSAAATTSAMTTTTATTAPATTATTATTPAGQKVGAAELPAIVSDRTFRGKDDAGESYSEYYAADGTLRGSSGGEAYSGSWKVVGEQLCFTYPDGGTSETECYAVFKNGDAVTWLTSDGRIVEATYAEGNPDNL